MPKINVTFQGSCANFRGVVPGRPHRVVLPNGNAMRFGVVTLPGTPPEEWEWCVPPHAAFVAVMPPSLDLQLTVPGVIDHGRICRPVHLQIVNACSTGGPQYEDSYNSIPSLLEYVDHFQYSSDVVQRGRALCYFDVMEGCVCMVKAVHAHQAQVTMETDGPPLLRVTPLSSADGPVQSIVLKLPDAAVTEMLVVNSGVDCEKTEGFDFMLHFLTAAGGIPFDLKKTPPGWPKKKVDPMSSLRRMLDGGQLDPFRLDPARALAKIVDLPTIHISCSDSRYP